MENFNEPVNPGDPPSVAVKKTVFVVPIVAVLRGPEFTKADPADIVNAIV